MGFQRVSIGNGSLGKIKEDLVAILSVDGACILEGIESGDIDSLYVELRAAFASTCEHHTPFFNRQDIVYPDHFCKPGAHFSGNLALKNSFERVLSRYAFFAEIFDTSKMGLAGFRYFKITPVERPYSCDPHIDDDYTLAFCPQGEALAVIVRGNVFLEKLTLDQALLVAPGIPHAVRNNGVEDRYSLIMRFLRD